MFTENKKIKILLFLAFIIFVGIFAMGKAKVSNAPVEKTEYSYTTFGGLAKSSDLIDMSIKEGVKVHGILSYRGTIQGAYFFEANIKVQILDANKNVLKESNGVATSEWMTEGPVDFEGNIDFTGLPTTLGYFRLANDNPSGDSALDKYIDIPIVIN